MIYEMKKVVCFITAAVVLSCMSVIAAADTGETTLSGITQGQWVLGGICAVFVTGAVVLAVLALKDGVSVRHHDGRDTDSSMGRKK